MAGDSDIAARDWTALAALSVLWGGSFIYFRVLAAELPALTTVAGRVAIGGAALAVLLAARGTHLVWPRTTWRQFLILGVLNNVIPSCAFAWGETRVESGTAAILNALTPMCALLVTCLVFRTERLTAARAGGIGCGIAGVAVLVGPHALLGQDLWGQAACLAGAVSYGFAAPYARQIKGVPPPLMALGQLAGSTAIAVPLMLIVDRPWTLPSPSAVGWGALLGLAVLSTTLAYLVFFHLLARIGATNLTLVTLLMPISALLLGWLALGETVTFESLAGMSIIAAGLALIDGRVLRRRRLTTPA